MNKLFFVFSIAFCSSANASTAFNSEFSHFSGGFVIAALTAYIIVRFFKKYHNKAIFWGFWVSTIFVTISQTKDYILSGKPWGQALDFFWHTVGALLAVFVLRKLIKPVNKDDVAAPRKKDDQIE